MDYMLPRFSDIPPMACLAKAVEDAIAHLGGVSTESHLAPEHVLRAIRSGGERSPQ